MMGDNNSAVLFDNELPDVAGITSLPALIEDIKFDNSSSTALMTNPDHLVMTIYSIFMILKLISVGHPKSQPYYEEICAHLFPRQALDECEAKLFASFNKKFNQQNRDKPSPSIVEHQDDEKQPAAATNKSLFEGIIDVLMFEMKNLVSQSKLGQNLELVICFHFDNPTDRGRCVSKLDSMLSDLKKKFKELDNGKLLVRRKRSSCPPPSPAIISNRRFMHEDPGFTNNHTRPNSVFENVYDKVVP
jgi:hypothetical protein